MAAMLLRALILITATFFVYIMADAGEAKTGKKLQISLQRNKYGEGCYLFLPSFVKLSDVKVAGFEGQREDAVFSLEETEGRILVKDREGRTTAEVWQSDNMPCLWAETEAPLEELEADKKQESAGRLTLFSPGGRVVWQGEMEAMHGHGNSTWYENKKSWQIKLPDKTSLLGMKPAKKWLLISNVKDASMMRNKLFLDMARECGLPGALSCEWVDFYLNGAYQGLYLLSEKPDVASGRLEIGDLEEENKALNGDIKSYANYTLAVGEETLLQGWFLPKNPENIKGGYLLEIEYPLRYAAEPSKFLTKSGVNVVVKKPAYASAEQIQYIYGFVQDFESALFSADERLPEGEAIEKSRTGMAYTEMIDMDSFAGRYVLDEISKDIDANTSSAFFYKPRYADKLYAGPVWDYDLALGNNGGWGEAEALHDPEGFYVNQAGWHKALYESPAFYETMRTQYQKSYRPWIEKFLKKGFSAYQEKIAQAAKMDNCYRGIDTWENGADEMRLFLAQRKEWLDKQWLDGN